MKRSKTSGFAVALPFLLPSIAGFLVFSLIPIIATLFISLTSWDGLSQLTLVNNFSGFMSKYFVGINNYIKIFEGREIYQVLLNTLKFVVLYIPLMLVASLCIAGILNSKVHGVGFFRVVYYIPVITSWVAGSLIWRWVLNPQYGIMNAMLAVIGISWHAVASKSAVVNAGHCPCIGVEGYGLFRPYASGRLAGNQPGVL